MLKKGFINVDGRTIMELAVTDGETEDEVESLAELFPRFIC